MSCSGFAGFLTRRRSGPGLITPPEVRRAKVRRHPFLIVYMVHSDQLVILAVAHTKKKPGYWASRIDKAPRIATRRSKRKPARSTSHEKERDEQISPPRSAEIFLPVFSLDSFLLEENVVSSTLCALTRAERC